LALGMSDTSQMRGRLQRRLFDDALDGGVRALACRSARAVSYRDKGRCKRLKPADATPEELLGFVGFGRRGLERNRDGVWVGDEVAKGQAASARLPAPASASQSFTVSFPAPEAIASLARGFKPAAWNHPCTSRSEKPRRRWAYSVRRNSRSCG